MRNIFSLTLLFMLGLLLFATCTKAEEAEAAKEDEPVVLQIMSSTITEKPEGVVEQGIADKFMELNSNIKIEFIPTPSNQMNQQILTRATGDNLPDAFMVFPDFLQQAHSMGILLDLKKEMEPDYYNGFLDSALSQISIDGELPLFPWHIIPPGVMYRTDWLEETGLGVPTNWDEFLEVAKAMTKDTDGDGNVDQWGFSMVGTNNGSGQSRFMHMARNFGMDDVREVDGKWVSGADAPEFEQALKYFTDLFTKYAVVPPGPTETGYPEAANYFATGKTGMMLTGSNGLGFVMAKNPDLNGKIGSFNVPLGSRQVGILSLSGYGITSTSKHPKEMLEYLKFMVNKKNAAKFSEMTGRMPTRKESASSDFFSQPVYKGFVEAMQNPYVIPNFPRVPELWNIFGEAYTAIMSGTQSFDEALSDARAKGEQVAAEVNNSN